MGLEHIDLHAIYATQQEAMGRYILEKVTAGKMSAALLQSSVASESIDVVEQHLRAIFPYDPKADPHSPFSAAQRALTAAAIALVDLREQGLISSEPTLLMDHLHDRDRFIFLMRKAHLRDPRAIEAVRAVKRGRHPFRARTHQRTVALIERVIGSEAEWTPLP